jgi:2-methylcitrate dehydratase PrpD
VANAVAALSAFFGARQATLFGRPERPDVLHAALLNGISSHVLDRYRHSADTEAIDA